MAWLEGARLERDEPAAWTSLAWRHERPDLDRLGSWSGSALGLAILAAELSARPEPGRLALPAPLVLSAGECVRRGVPTAVRASVASVGPMDGTYAEGQVGGELGPRLAAVTDALVLARSRARAAGAPGGVLEVGLARDGGPRVVLHRGELARELAGLPPVEAGRWLRERFGPSACVRVGPAAERGVPFASLAVGGDEPSFVGRGGLGLAFAALGLKALVVTAPAAAVRDGRADAGPGSAAPAPLARPRGRGARADAGLAGSLARSPRLAARCSGGAVELGAAFAARGDLHARHHERALSAEEGLRLAGEAAGAAREQRGCRGCPTPCGWVFETQDGGRQHGRFTATYALGPNVGLERFADAVALLERCDRAGIDAVETGAALALLCRAGERAAPAGGAPVPRFGDRDALARAIDEIGSPEGPGALLARGAAVLARDLGLDGASFSRGAQSARPERDLAAVLAQCVSAAGPDPMRTFPFLTDGGGEAARAMAALLGPRAAPEGAELARCMDPADPRGKGRIVWAYENWKAAVDATGFCAFSAAGLLADGELELDELARAIAPAALLAEDEARAAREGRPPRPGRALVAAGASIALLRRELDALLGADPERDRPPWARALVDRPGMLDEYRAARGLDARGRPTARALALVGSLEAADPAGELGAPGPGVLELGVGGAPAEAAAAREPARTGSVALRSVGPLAERLGPSPRVELPLPAPLGEVLRAASRSAPGAARYLLRDDRPVPAVYRSGRRVAEDELVHAGDVLDLVVAIRGG